MPSSRSHEPSTGFTTTSMRLRREIRDVLLPQITSIDALKSSTEGLAASTHFCLETSQIDSTTYKVSVRYRNPHIGSTVAQLHLSQSATELQAAKDAILASLSDGWIWQVT
jgi:hypothetical protein